jgi:hypothetical protein
LYKVILLPNLLTCIRFFSNPTRHEHVADGCARFYRICLLVFNFEIDQNRKYLSDKQIMLVNIINRLTEKCLTEQSQGERRRKQIRPKKDLYEKEIYYLKYKKEDFMDAENH